MKNIMKTLIKKSLAFFALVALVAGSAVLPGAGSAQAAAGWDISGDYIININLEGDDPDANYPHEVSFTQDAGGNLSGGGSSGGGVFTWVITSGSVDGDTVQIDAEYTADASADGTIFTLDGTVAADGSISGTWSDNYQGGERVGTFSTEAGVATEIELPETVKVTIVKYIDGALATAESADNTDFLMNASWDAENIGAGSGQFSLSETGFNNPNPYHATTSDMTTGADYSTSEVSDSDIVGTACVEGGAPYALTGYRSGNTLSEAQAATTTMVAPSFTDMASDKYVLVLNDDCATPGVGGEIGGEVIGDEGELEVTSVETLDGTAVADGTYESGWKFRFNITVPTDENGVAMKFANWDIDGAATDSIPAANNMRISSAQAVSETPITVTAADTYTVPDMEINEDLNPSLDGLQIQVLVEVKVPSGTANGSYTTSYGVRTQ